MREREREREREMKQVIAVSFRFFRMILMSMRRESCMWMGGCVGGGGDQVQIFALVGGFIGDLSGTAKLMVGNCKGSTQTLYLVLGVGAEETKRICGTIQTITGIALQKKKKFFFNLCYITTRSKPEIHRKKGRKEYQAFEYVSTISLTDKCQVRTTIGGSCPCCYVCVTCFEC